MKIYVASSWRNLLQRGVVYALRAANFSVYDFRKPPGGGDGFHWSEIDPKWKEWTPEQYRQALVHPVAAKGYAADFAAMQEADVCVLVLPCGRSAHLEAGWFAGVGKPVHVLMVEAQEPELMYLLFGPDCISTSVVELLGKLGVKD